MLDTAQLCHTLARSDVINVFTICLVSFILLISQVHCRDVVVPHSVGMLLIMLGIRTLVVLSIMVCPSSGSHGMFLVVLSTGPLGAVLDS